MGWVINGARCGAMLAAFVTIWPSCSSSPALPSTVDSGFNFQTDAFTFANFANQYPSAHMTPLLASRMFGPAVACVKSTTTTCKPSGLTEQWLSDVNFDLSEGYSEGMAVLAQLFFLKRLSPKNFGAATAGALVLDGNEKLQQELAYWAATQNAPASVTNQGFQANTVMPFLATALAPGATESYRLAMARTSASGPLGGHSVTPIGYVSAAEAGVYYLRIYDNNFPQAERQVTIDTIANTWTYDASTDAKDPVVYSGSASDGNLLYLSPVTTRLSTLIAPFGASSPVVTVSGHGSQIAVTDGSGNVNGVQGGKIVQSGKGTVTPGFSNCPCAPSYGVMHVTVPAGQSQTVTATPSTNALVDGGQAYNLYTGLTVSSGGSSATVTNAQNSSIGGASNSAVSIVVPSLGDGGTSSGATWQVKNAGTNTVRVMQSLPNGETATTTVTCTTTCSNVMVVVNGSTASVTASPTGTPFTTTVTLTKSGETSSTTVACPGTGQATCNGSAAVSTQTLAAMDTTAQVAADYAHCSNGRKDEGETGVDCGGGAAETANAAPSSTNGCPTKCPDGAGCRETADCMAGAICGLPESKYPAAGYVISSVGTCFTPSCHDGAWLPPETDVDCGGGVCGACPVTYGCKTASDCAPGLTCVSCNAGAINCARGAASELGNFCLAEPHLVVTLEPMPAGSSATFTAKLNGGSPLTHTLTSDGSATAVDLGPVNEYDLTYVSADFVTPSGKPWPGTPSCSASTTGAPWGLLQNGLATRVTSPPSINAYIQCSYASLELATLQFTVEASDLNHPLCGTLPVYYSLDGAFGTIPSYSAATAGNPGGSTLTLGTFFDLGTILGLPTADSPLIVTDCPTWPRAATSCEFINGTQTTTTYSTSPPANGTALAAPFCTTVAAPLPDAGHDAAHDAGGEAGAHDATVGPPVAAFPTTCPVGSVYTEAFTQNPVSAGDFVPLVGPYTYNGANAGANEDTFSLGTGANNTQLWVGARPAWQNYTVSSKVRLDSVGVSGAAANGGFNFRIEADPANGANDQGMMYYAGISLSSVQLGTENNGTYTQLAAPAGTFAVGTFYTLTVTVSGPYLSVAVNGVTYINSLLDSSFTHGSFGLRTYDASMTYGPITVTCGSPVTECNGVAGCPCGGSVGCASGLSCFSVDGGQETCGVAGFTVGGTLSNLVQGTIVLQDNHGANLSLSTNGPFTFGTDVSAGAPYSVTILTQPDGQLCTVSNGSGTASANVTSVSVSCIIM